MKGGRLLAIFAHPDDESFGTGGTLARYAAAGVRVTLVCATRGEAGEIADPSLATPETLPRVREEELRCAARALGIAEVVLLGYRDSGMAGAPANRHPRALVNVPAEEVVPRLVSVMRRTRPHVVITFEPNGVYGHPDHMAVHRHAVTAFHAAGDGSRYPDQGEPWQPARLFYTALPRSFFRQMRARLEAIGVEVDAFRHFEEAGWPDEQLHVALDVSATLKAKWAALECHRTQFGPDHPFRRLPPEAMREMISREYFVLAWPEPVPGLRLPELAAGLDGGWLPTG